MAGKLFTAKRLADYVPFMFSCDMPSVNPESVSAAIRSAPAFARLGLSMRDPHYRERAIEALSLAIVEKLEAPTPVHDANQIPLPL